MLFLALTAILALVSLPTPSASQEDHTTLTLTLPDRVISAIQQAVCPSDEVQETAKSEIIHKIRNLTRSSLYLTSEGEDNFLLLCQHLGVAPEEGLSLRDKYQNAHRSPPLHFRLVLRFQNVHIILCRTL